MTAARRRLPFEQLYFHEQEPVGGLLIHHTLFPAAPEEERPNHEDGPKGWAISSLLMLLLS